MKTKRDNTVKIVTIIFVVLSAILIISLNRTCIYVTNKVETMSTEYSAYLGKKVVIDKDTLIIVTYSIISETFNLSNGTSIHYQVAKQNLLTDESN